MSTVILVGMCVCLPQFVAPILRGTFSLLKVALKRPPLVPARLPARLPGIAKTRLRASRLRFAARSGSTSRFGSSSSSASIASLAHRRAVVVPGPSLA